MRYFFFFFRTKGHRYRRETAGLNPAPHRHGGPRELASRAGGKKKTSRRSRTSKVHLLEVPPQEVLEEEEEEEEEEEVVGGGRMKRAELLENDFQVRR